MFHRLRAAVTYANVIATLALFVALGGTAYGLVVNGAVVQDESLTDADIRNGSLGPAIARDAITGDNVANDSLRGEDVDEATLTVGEAANAAKVAGATVLWASVNADGSVARSEGLAAASHPRTGDYFLRPDGVATASCTYVAAPGATTYRPDQDPPVGFVNAQPYGFASLGENLVRVRTFDAAGAARDMPFHLMALCR